MDFLSLLNFFFTILVYPIALTSIITFLYSRNQTEWFDVFTFVCLSIVICYFYPALYILLMANLRFR